MLYEDKDGRLLVTEEVNELTAREIEELGIHIYEDAYT